MRDLFNGQSACLLRHRIISSEIQRSDSPPPKAILRMIKLKVTLAHDYHIFNEFRVVFLPVMVFLPTLPYFLDYFIVDECNKSSAENNWVVKMLDDGMFQLSSLPSYAPGTVMTKLKSNVEVRIKGCDIDIILKEN